MTDSVNTAKLTYTQDSNINAFLGGYIFGRNELGTYITYYLDNLDNQLAMDLSGKSEKMDVDEALQQNPPQMLAQTDDPLQQKHPQMLPQTEKHAEQFSAPISSPAKTPPAIHIPNNLCTITEHEPLLNDNRLLLLSDACSQKSGKFINSEILYPEVNLIENDDSSSAASTVLLPINENDICSTHGTDSENLISPPPYQSKSPIMPSLSPIVPIHFKEINKIHLESCYVALKDCGSNKKNKRKNNKKKINEYLVYILSTLYIYIFFIIN